MQSPENQLEHKLSDFYRFANFIAHTFDVQDMFRQLVRFLAETFTATTAAIFLYHPEFKQLKLAVYHSQLAHIDWVAFQSALSPKILLLLSKYRKAVLSRTQSDEVGCEFMFAPLTSPHKTLGIVVVEKQQTHSSQPSQQLSDTQQPHFTTQDLYILGAVTLMVSNRITNLQRFLVRKRHVNRLEALNQITLKLSSMLNTQTIYEEAVTDVAKLLHCRKSCILYVKEECLHIGYIVGNTQESANMLVPLDGALAGALHHSRTIHTDTIPSFFEPVSGSGACLIVPVLRSFEKTSKPQEIICVAESLRNNPFTRQDKNLLSFIANQVGIALANAALYEKATVDFLTKVYVRGHFFEKLQESLRECERKFLAASLLMLDIDLFKRVNDTYGHPVGDCVLQELGELLKNCIRQHDMVGRYGGEEFVVFLHATTYESAFKIAERIRLTIANHIFAAGKLSWPVTVSIGVVQYLPPENSDSWVARADQALYKAKHNGRNRVC